MLLLRRQSPSLKLFRIFYDSLPKPDEVAAILGLGPPIVPQCRDPGLCQLHPQASRRDRRLVL